MESSNSLATESFSRSWLTNTVFSIDDQEDPARTSLHLFDEATLKDTNWEIGNSNRFTKGPQHPNFDFHSSEFSPPLVHADEIFANGRILPVYREEIKKGDLKPSKSTSLISSTTPLRNDDDHSFLIDWKRTSKKVFLKYFGLFKPLYSKLGCTREGVKVDDFNRKLRELSSLENSLLTSPPPQRRDIFMGELFDVVVKTECESGDLERDLRKCKSWSHVSPRANTAVEWGVESSIYEAILHCKRSFEN